MTQLVQANCPRCKHLLRIPADWAHQALRCKHCGQVIQMKVPATPAPAPPRTPAPATRPRAITPAPVAVPVAPAVPMAAPVAMPVGASPFDVVDDTPAPSARRRRRKGSRWKALAVVFCLLAIAGGAIGVAWPHIREALSPPEKDKDKVVASTDGPGERPSGNPTGVPTTKRRPVTPTSKPIGPRPPTTNKRPPIGGDPIKPPPDPTKDPRAGANRFPRRALVISVHNYLYANPVHYGIPGPGGHDVVHFLEVLARENGFKIPLNQIAHLSDSANKGQARPPMKPMIEQAITSFLDSSRAQDRVMVFFIGHAVEIKGTAYLMPIEGELDRAATLIPLDWVYEKMSAAKARQKVLVLDVSRYNPTTGRERPDGGPLSEKFVAALQKPPAGVQVWCACSANQHSYETDDAPQGTFIEALYVASMAGVQGKIQRPDDPLPLEYFHNKVNQQLANEAELKRRKLEQVAFLAGQEPENGAAYDRNEPQPPTPSLPPYQNNRENIQLVKGVLDQVGAPPIKPSRESNNVTYDALPPFDAAVLKNYEDDGDKDSPLHKAVKKARAVLWAVSGGGEPTDLSGEVREVRGKLRANLSVLRDGFRAPAPAAEAAFKGQVEANERDVARILGLLRETYEELEAAKDMRDSAPKRWQANYDFVLARLEAQIAFLFEYQSALGRMRKELPERDPTLHGGWLLAASTTLEGDPAGKKMEKNARKLLDKLAKDHAGTPWEVLAKREKLTALGLKWEPTR